MTTRVLLIGGGAREHAMARALADSGAEIHVVMKNLNPGLADLATKFAVGRETDADLVVEHAGAWGSEIALSGPESPIAEGVTDALAEAGLRLASPTQAAGRIETDKAWMRQLQEDNDLPGGIRSRHFDGTDGLAAYIEELGEVAVKPIGLTGGKGVKVTGEHLDDVEAAVAYAEEVLGSDYGGGEVVIEEKLVGEEFTVQCFTDGTTVVPTPAVQDHKRAYEGDEGPNTGGMGAYSDTDGLLPFLNQTDYDRAVEIVQAHVDALREDGHPYVGTIYGQFMLTAEGPKVIEINARFGDPEAMNTLPVLETSYLDIVEAMAGGTLDKIDIGFAPKATVCKYVVPKGYGTKPADDVLVKVDQAAIDKTGARLYYASCNAADQGVRTTTSRTLAVVGIAESLEAANAQAEAALEHVEGDDIYIRHDIGTEDLITKRVAHMRALGRDPR